MKLRLPDRAAYDKAALLFGGSNTQAVYAQENFFFDGSKQELSSKKTILRLRFYNTDEKAQFTIKVRIVDHTCAKVDVAYGSRYYLFFHSSISFRMSSNTAEILC